MRTSVTARREGRGLAQCTLLLAALSGCTKSLDSEQRAGVDPARAPTSVPAPSGVQRYALANRFAYIPPQCYTKTRGEGGRASNPCYACHVRSAPPNYINDADLQLALTLPAAAGTFVCATGLFPLNTEFLHSARYLDVGLDGAVTLAPRMKELRYAKKVRWLSGADLERTVAHENVEQAASPDGVVYFVPQADRGVYNGQGWLLQGFIEAADGVLRPQSYEETVACVGCHGGIGATTDSIFSLPRKLPPTSAARGWFHWSQHGLRGIPEPRRRDGHYEYTLYLEEAAAGDELRENAEVLARFFDDGGRLRPVEIARLHADIGTLLLPSSERAIDLDGAYQAIVREQSFVRGRDAVLAPASHLYARAPVGDRTGIDEAVGPP